MPDRTRLPNRRPSFTAKIEHAGHKFHISWSRDAAGAVREVFIAGGKDGQMLRHMTEDAAIVASLALQFGARLEDLLAAVGRDPSGDDRMASPLGAALLLIHNSEMRDKK